MRISVIISNRNDVERLAITVRSCIEGLTAVPGGGEIVIADNSSSEIYDVMSAILPAGYIREGKIKLVRQNFPCLFTAREMAVREAKGEYVLCVDSHCLIGHNTIIDLVHFMNRNKGKPIGFAHAPINWLCQHERASRHDMKLIYGTWGKGYDHERLISWKGMPWICRRDWFLNILQGYGALSQYRLAWGGGDMHIGLKSWILGYENWAVPTRPIIHIGPLPIVARKFAYRYRLYGKSGEQVSWMGQFVSVLALHGECLFENEGFVKFMEERNCINIKENYNTAMDLAHDERNRIKKDRQRTFESLIENPPWEQRNYKEVKKEYTKTFGANPKTIKEEDWELMIQLIDTYSIKSVLEFGSGLSTMLFESRGISVFSYESDKEYIKKLQPLVKTKINPMSNGTVIPYKQHDMALIDGDLPRTNQALLAKSRSNIVFVHDGHKRQCGHSAALLFSDWPEIPNETRLSRIFIKEVT